MRKLPRKIIAHFSLELWNNEKGSQIIKKSECGLLNDHFGRLTSVTLVLIIKNKLGSAQVPKFGRLLVKIDIGAGSGVPGGAEAPPELFLAPPEPFEPPLTIKKIMH